MVDILINIEFHCHQTKFLQRCKPYQQPSYQDLVRHSYQKLLRRLDPHLDSMWLMRSVCLLAVHARARLLIALNPQWAILSFFEWLLKGNLENSKKNLSLFEDNFVFRTWPWGFFIVRKMSFSMLLQGGLIKTSLATHSTMIFLHQLFAFLRNLFQVLVAPKASTYRIYTFFSR